MTIESIAFAGDILVARYLREGHASDLDAAIHALEMRLKTLPSTHPMHPLALQNYQDRLELKMALNLSGHMSARRENMYRRAFYMIAQVPEPFSLHLDDSDLKILKPRQESSLEGFADSGPDTVCRPQKLGVVISNEIVYEDFTPIRFPRGSYSTDLKLSIDGPGLYTRFSSLRPSSHKNILPFSYAIISRRGKVNLPAKVLSDWDMLLSEGSSIEKQLNAAVNVAEWMLAHNEWQGLSDVWRHCFAHRDTTNIHSLKFNGYKAAFKDLATLAVKVASGMLMQECDVWSPIRVLEQGREALNCFELLPAQPQRIKHSPHLERQVQELVADLKSPGTVRNTEFRRSPFRHLDPFERRSREFVKAVQDLTKCESDMRPFNFEHCIKQTRSGPIIYLITATAASRAIILTPLKNQVLHLKSCNYNDGLQKLAILRCSLKECEADYGLTGEANQELRQLLKWIWDTVVHPIINALHLQPNPSSDALSRLQWICCGLFSQMPVHAAGIFTKPRKPHLAQYAVSSSLSSIRYTVLARRKTPYLAPTASQILIVSMPETEDLASLNTAAEVDAITAQLHKSLNTCFLTAPDMGTLQSLIGGCRVAHFSCHGITDATDPLKSRLVIAREKERLLTVQAVRELSGAFARLAFLSACRSADYEDLDTADEVVHVAKAFQLAGIPSVVGTLWQAFDEDVAVVVGAFYGYMARRLREGRKLDGDVIARALHFATGELRARNPLQCVGWAAWIHYGD